MALIGFEGFDNIAAAATTDLARMPFGGTGASQKGTWNTSATGGLSKQAGLLGGFAITASSASFSGVARLGLFADYPTLILGFRMRTDTRPNQAYQLFALKDGGTSGTVQCGVNIDSNGHLFAWRGTSATILETGTTNLTFTAWYMIEAKVTIDNAVGVVDVYIDGALEFSFSGDTQNSANASADAVEFVFAGTGDATESVLWIDDFYLLDDTGSAPYNAPLGVVRVETLYVSANDSVTWTPLSSTNASNVDEASMDSDTTYNSCSAAAKDTFTHGALINTPVNIFAVDMIAAVKKTDVTNQTYHTIMVSSGSTSNGTDMNPNTAYTYARDSYLTDPATSTSWTAASVNATKIGYERT